MKKLFIIVIIMGIIGLGIILPLYLIVSNSTEYTPEVEQKINCDYRVETDVYKILIEDYWNHGFNELGYTIFYSIDIIRNKDGKVVDIPYSRIKKCSYSDYKETMDKIQRDLDKNKIKVEKLINKL